MSSSLFFLISWNKRIRYVRVTLWVSEGHNDESAAGQESPLPGFACKEGSLPGHGEITYSIYTHSAATSVFLNKLFIILYAFIPLARALVDFIGYICPKLMLCFLFFSLLHWAPPASHSLVLHSHQKIKLHTTKAQNSKPCITIIIINVSCWLNVSL